jgi:hypothetical protein
MTSEWTTNHSELVDYAVPRGRHRVATELEFSRFATLMWNPGQ